MIHGYDLRGFGCIPSEEISTFETFYKNGFDYELWGDRRVIQMLRDQMPTVLAFLINRGILRNEAVKVQGFWDFPCVVKDLHIGHWSFLLRSGTVHLIRCHNRQGSSQLRIKADKLILEDCDLTNLKIHEDTKVQSYEGGVEVPYQRGNQDSIL